MLELTKKDLGQIRKWVTALRSGKYKQTAGALHNPSGFCCLGVACDIAIPKSKLQVTTKNGSSRKYIAGGFPESQVNAPEWLKKINNDFAKLNHTETLSTKNDGGYWKFKDIANAIEATYLTPRKTTLSELVAIELKLKG